MSQCLQTGKGRRQNVLSLSHLASQLPVSSAPASRRPSPKGESVLPSAVLSPAAHSSAGAPPCLPSDVQAPSVTSDRLSEVSLTQPHFQPRLRRHSCASTRHVCHLLFLPQPHVASRLLFHSCCSFYQGCSYLAK
ncbi:unnamed protein product [Rangifer tarandus platyrhynchus]|uniref:Uncharacterized protein n=1 Tax=Rangifer tarandus platyrhynchus TaxID=3082113 RepID=A0AC59ZXZ5_RANTA